MAVFIYEKDAFDKLLAVENFWHKHDYDKRGRGKEFYGDSSFDAFLEKWNKLSEKTKKYRPEFEIEVSSFGSTINGCCGWHRYIVLNSGEILFLRNSLRIKNDSAKIEKIREVGFRIFPEDKIKQSF